MSPKPQTKEQIEAELSTTELVTTGCKCDRCYASAEICCETYNKFDSEAGVAGNVIAVAMGFLAGNLLKLEHEDALEQMIHGASDIALSVARRVMQLRRDAQIPKAAP